MTKDDVIHYDLPDCMFSWVFPPGLQHSTCHLAYMLGKWVKITEP